MPYRNDELTRILERVVELGLRSGWAEFEDTPLAIPRIQLAQPRSQDGDAPPANESHNNLDSIAPK